MYQLSQKICATRTRDASRLDWPLTDITLSRFVSVVLKRGIAGTALALCVLSVPGIAATGTLTVYAELEEPANYVEGEAQPVPVGQGYDLVLAVLAAAGLKAEVKVVHWTRLIRSLESEKNVLGFSMTRTPQREDRFLWVGLIRPVNFKLWALAERAPEIPDSLEAATELRVSATRGDVVEQYLLSQNFTNLVYLSESSNAITMLRRGRVDMIGYIESGMPDYLARKNEPPGTLVPVIDLHGISTGHYMVMSKQTDPDLFQRLRDAYQAVVASGEFSDLISGATSN